MDFLVTQLFFDNAAYFDFVERARAIGIDVPIIPGILPITNIAQLERITSLCGAAIPEPLRRELDARADEPEAVEDFGVAYATLQCAELLAGGAPGHPLLHAQPLAGDARDPRRPAAQPPLGGRDGLRAVNPGARARPPASRAAPPHRARARRRRAGRPTAPR